MPLATDVTITASDAPTALDPAPPVVPGPNAEVMAFVHDQSVMGSLVGNDIVLEFFEGNLQQRWVFGNRVDEPLAFESYTAGVTAVGSGSAHSVYADRQGSVTHVVADASATVVESRTYDSFGQATVVGNIQRYGFTSREADGESGLNYYRARVYDPAIGRFLQQDPIEFAAGDMNVYAYVKANPYFATDPSGLLKDKTRTTRVTGQVGQWLSTTAAQSSARARAIGSVGGGIIGTAAVLAAYLGSIDLDFEEGLPDDESPTPEEPEPSAEGAGQGPPENHHCYPVSYGFDPKQSTKSFVPRVNHQRLHRLMRQYFQEISNRFLNQIASMDYGPGRRNSDIAEAVGIKTIKKELDKFYEKFPEFGC